MLIANWRGVLKHAWSVRLLAGAALFSGLEVALPFLDGYLPISEWGRALIYFGVTVAALALRFVAQPSVAEAAPPSRSKD